MEGRASLKPPALKPVFLVATSMNHLPTIPKDYKALGLDLEGVINETQLEMKNEPIKQQNNPQKKREQQITHLVTPEFLVEMLYNSERSKTWFSIFNRETKLLNEADSFQWKEVTYLPLSSTNPLVKEKFIRFPSALGDYGTEAQLLRDISKFMAKWMTFSPFYEKLAPHLVKFSWVHDRFDELAYSRFLADTGKGKTRALETLGAISYRPIFSGGAVTASPLFRIIDEYGGTLIIDEADLRFSNETNEITKILNQGFKRGFPVLRSESTGNSRNFEPQMFNVYGPKILATRKRFQDDALETRCITEDLDKVSLRRGIPLNLTPDFWRGAEQLQNKLLRWRLENFDAVKLNPRLEDPILESRLNQITIPLKSTIRSRRIRDDLTRQMREYQREIVQTRALSTPGIVFQCIISLLESGPERIYVQDIAEKYNLDVSEKEKIGARKVGLLVRNVLKIDSVRDKKGYYLCLQGDHLEALRDKYGLNEVGNITKNVRGVRGVRPTDSQIEQDQLWDSQKENKESVVADIE